MDTDSKTVYGNSQERGLQVKLTATLCFLKNQRIIENGIHSRLHSLFNADYAISKRE